VCTMAHSVLQAEPLFGVHFYCRIQFHHVAGPNLVGAGDGHCCTGLGDLMVP
jgi:hypothetical protein